MLQKPSYRALETGQGDGEIETSLGIIHQDIPLNSLGIQHFQETGRTLLKAELGNPKRFLCLSH
jgi:hypothetical protein